MSKNQCCALILSALAPLAGAQGTEPEHPARLKYQVEVAGVRLGMPEAEAMQRVRSANPGFRIKPLKLASRVSGWLATADTPACERASIDCEETLRVESIDGKVYTVSHTRSFAPGSSAPAFETVRSALQHQYGMLVALGRPPGPDDGILEQGFRTDGQATSEACVAVSEPAAGGRWLYGYAGACDWVFNAEATRTPDGKVRAVDIVLGDAQAAYRTFGGLPGVHKPALGAVVARQRERDVMLAHRPGH